MSTRMYGCTATLGDELESRRGDNDFDRYAVAVLRKGVVVVHLPRLLLTQALRTLWHCWTFLLTSLSSFADRRVQSFSSGSIVSLTLIFNMLTIACGFVSYFFNFTDLVLTNLSLHRQSFFSANISSYMVS